MHWLKINVRSPEKMNKRKILSIFIISITLLVGYIFRWNIAPLQKKELKNSNPTSYIFSSDLTSVRDQLISAFSTENQVKNKNIFSFKSLSRPEYARDLILTMETKKDVLFAKSIFENQVNQNDIYLHTFGDPIKSHSYYALGKPLEYRVSFHIHFQSEQEGQTAISIIAVNPTVIKGIGGLGAHGFFSKDIPVSPTTIEEYELLRYIGYLLGEKNILAANYPE